MSELSDAPFWQNKGKLAKSNLAGVQQSEYMAFASSEFKLCV